MTTTFLLAMGQTVVFLAVCGLAPWAARLIAEAANDSAVAAERAEQAVREAEAAAADVREMRGMLRTWLHEQARDGLDRRPAGRVGTDTAETQAVLTPQAIVDGGTTVARSGNAPGEGSRAHRGRHARPTDLSWTAALRAAAARTGRTR